MSNFMGAALTVDDIYPVGSIYMSVNATDPARLFGGTWERIKEKFLLGAGDTHTPGSTGGEFEHKLTVPELASHYHHGLHIDSPDGLDVLYGNNPNYKQTSLDLGSSYRAGVYEGGIFTARTGEDKPHNNTPLFGSVHLEKNRVNAAKAG